jgi:hypothetical protein
MSGKFISFIIAASIAVTGMTAAPAQASDRDLARALAAIAGVAIIGVAINEGRKDKRHAAPREHRVQKQYRALRAQAYQPRRPAVERAYRQGVRDQRHVTRERRAERRVERRHGYGQQRGYGARPYGYGH